MRKSYTLLKDLPDVKAGAIFEIGIVMDAYYLTSDKTGTGYNCYCYPKEFVENSPGWFKEVKKYPMCKDQSAQIDCRLTDCRFHRETACRNPSPAITLNPDQAFYCWSFSKRITKNPKSKPEEANYSTPFGLLFFDEIKRITEEYEN